MMWQTSVSIILKYNESEGSRKHGDLLEPFESQKLITAATPKRRENPALNWTPSSLKYISHQLISFFFVKWWENSKVRQAEIRKLQIHSRKLEIPKHTSALPPFSYAWATSKTPSCGWEEDDLLLHGHRPFCLTRRRRLCVPALQSERAEPGNDDPLFRSLM